MNAIRFAICVLLTTIYFVVGCATSRPVNDPLVGWKGLGSAYIISCPFGQTIIDDYQNYIRNLSALERSSADDFHIKFYEGGESQRAVEITINLNGTRWKHVLIYDHDNKRIRLIKYASSRYQS